jgi:hypothetical protein
MGVFWAGIFLPFFSKASCLEQFHSREILNKRQATKINALLKQSLFPFRELSSLPKRGVRLEAFFQLRAMRSKNEGLRDLNDHQILQTLIREEIPFRKLALRGFERLAHVQNQALRFEDSKDNQLRRENGGFKERDLDEIVAHSGTYLSLQVPSELRHQSPSDRRALERLLRGFHSHAYSNEARLLKDRQKRNGAHELGSEPIIYRRSQSSVKLDPSEMKDPMDRLDYFIRQEVDRDMFYTQDVYPTLFFPGELVFVPSFNVFGVITRFYKSGLVSVYLGNHPTKNGYGVPLSYLRKVSFTNPRIEPSLKKHQERLRQFKVLARVYDPRSYSSGSNQRNGSYLVRPKNGPNKDNFLSLVSFEK